ncbi:hypothetical protein SADUNF_Sadunf10G0173200 [Salix dunnii]|uniref:Uncharacterized protein n=1 Tax=Salix dunnii TaxID=1413687 RepID=A0A835JP99_9ROSI|nr:hypothetical protein SADUNF_Sadunf10G0173200 [Salix dunnii]
MKPWSLSCFAFCTAIEYSKALLTMKLPLLCNDYWYSSVYSFVALSCFWMTVDGSGRVFVAVLMGCFAEVLYIPDDKNVSARAISERGMGNHGELDLPVWFRWTGKLMNGDCITVELCIKKLLVSMYPTCEGTFAFSGDSSGKL